jgi:UDP-N-acetylmuramoylalanine--D-glutamate ligase
MKISSYNFKGKKVLVFGLGLLGGGVSTTNWLVKHGADVTVTDLKTEKDLATSLRKIKSKVKLALGGHSEQMIQDHEIILLNQDISINNPFVQLAYKLGKTVLTEGLIFYNNWPKTFVGITGTRGKTTTTHWISHLLSAGMKSTIVGNSGDKPFLKVLDEAKRFDVAVAETPSFQLEFFDASVRTPDIAVITNISPDHLNRHGTLEGYASAKANIFRYQKEGQCIVLNAENDWTEYFINQKPKSYVWLFSKKSRLPKHTNGVFYKDESIWYQFGDHKQSVIPLKGFVAKYGQHNLENLLASALVAYLAGSTGKQIKDQISSLPQVPLRQETIFQNKKLRIINDTTATSPEGGIAALKRFAGPATVLITGGTDRQLEYGTWGKLAPKLIKLENMIFLNGSATQKMLAALGPKAKKVNVFETLEECLTVALKKAGKYQKSVVLFSPASKSFEKFKNEYDRGETFNTLVSKEVR